MENIETPITEPRYAGFWIRLLAHIIDSIILYAILYIIGLLLIPDVVDSSSPEEQARLMGAMNKLTLLGLFISASYEILLTSSNMQATIGKRALGLKIVNERGQRITITTAIFRYIGKILSSIILCIGFLMIAFSAKKRGLHDNLANTYVVKA